MTALGRVVGGLLLVMATLAGVATSAWGYWTSSGTGIGSATTATLDPPTSVTGSTTPGVPSVSLTWSRPASGVTPQGYTVTRITQPGGATAPACGGGTINGTSCTDSPLDEGTYRYRVTAAYASWSAASSLSDPVTVTAAPVDTTPPTVTAVSADAANGSYRAGAAIPITVTFSESVVVSTTGGTPTIALATASPGTTAVSYTSGSGTAELTFTYTVEDGDASVDLTYEATTSLALNGGTIRDSAGNDATLTLPTLGSPDSLSGSKDIVIDTTAPTVVSITRSGASPTNAASTSWTVTFSEPVSGVGIGNFALTTTGITGTPSLSTVTAAGVAPAATWTVTATTTGSTATAGTIALALANTAGIADAATNPLATTLTGEAYDYDTTPPSAASVTRSGATPTNAASLSWTVTFSEPVSGVTPGSFTLTTTGITGTGPTVTTAIPTSGGPTSGTWTVTATVTSTVAAGTIRLDLTNPAGIADAATNSLASTLSGEAYDYDNVAPAVTITGIAKVGGSGKVRVSGTGELGLPVTVHLCYFATAPTTGACTAADGPEILTIPALTATTWQSPNSSTRSRGTWYAVATQSDGAGNSTTTGVFGPYVN